MKGVSQFVIIENKRMEEMVRFVTRAYESRMNVEYQDQYYYKIES